MIICHVITSFGFGGAEKLLTDLINIQSKRHEVHIIYLKGEPLLQSMLSSIVTLHKIELNIGCAILLRTKIKLLKPDIIHTHLGHADLIGLWACRKIRVKKFCTMHNIWFKWNWKDDIIFLLYRILFSTVAKDCKVIAISTSVYSHVENVLKVPQSRIKLIYNAIPDLISESTKEGLRKELNISPSSFCVLFVGRLEIQKSVETLILAGNEIKNKIHNLKILIVGDGSLKENLQKLTKELCMEDNIVFTGTTKQVEKFFNATDVFVLPSIFEGFGIVILEAFRSSVPVIATNIEGPCELIKNEVNGLLFDPKNYKKLAEHIFGLYESADRREFIGANGFMSYKDKFNIDKYEQKVEELYLE